MAKVGNVEIEDTYAEACKGRFLRLLLTAEGAEDGDVHDVWGLWRDNLAFSAFRSTSTPSMVVGRPEAGIEKLVAQTETPDGRGGAILQFWGPYNPDDKKKTLQQQLEKFWYETSLRIRQDILSVPTTRLFDWNTFKETWIELIDTMEWVGKCGGGYEKDIRKYGRNMISVPLMSGHDFEIERGLDVGLGICGATVWVFGESEPKTRIAAKEAIPSHRVLSSSPYMITSFYACPSGSKAEDYPPIGPPTNDQYCPTLRERLRQKSKLRPNEKSVYEIVIDGVSLSAVRTAMNECIHVAKDMPGVTRISAGNYDGKIGDVKIPLRDVVPELFE